MLLRICIIPREMFSRGWDGRGNGKVSGRTQEIERQLAWEIFSDARGLDRITGEFFLAEKMSSRKRLIEVGVFKRQHLQCTHFILRPQASVCLWFFSWTKFASVEQFVKELSSNYLNHGFSVLFGENTVIWLNRHRYTDQTSLIFQYKKWKHLRALKLAIQHF